MRLTANAGRAAGLWYLLLVVLGPVRLLYIPTKLFVKGNAAVTFANVASHEMLFRVGILTDLMCGVVLIFLTLALYRVFARVDRQLAVLVIVFGGVLPAMICFVGVVSDFGVLEFVRMGDWLSGFSKTQLDGLAMLFVRLRNDQNTAAEILWGIWLLPLGLLVYRSRFLPRFLGVWLGLGGVAYLVISVTGILWPQHQGRMFALAQPALFSEMAFMLWLVIQGTPSVDVAGVLLPGDDVG